MSKMRRIRKARFALPSLVTLGSVFCSFFSMSLVIRAMSLAGDDRIELLFWAAIAIIGSIVFDLFDGKVARWTHTSTKFGMELDSLADGVSFGVAPAVLLYGFALCNAGIFGIIACFLYICGALLRLARFNIEAPEEGVQTYFKGIPSPGGAAGVASIVLAAISINFTTFTPFELKTLGVVAIFLGILMVSNVCYKTLKGKKTKADIGIVLAGIAFFGVMCFVENPSIAFFLLFCYFVAWGMLLTIYLNLKRGPRSSRRRKSVIDMRAVDSEHESSKSDESSRSDKSSRSDESPKSDESSKSDGSIPSDKQVQAVTTLDGLPMLNEDGSEVKGDKKD